MFFLFLHICNRGKVESHAWLVHRKGAFMEEWRFRRELSTETGLFVEKLRLMLAFSTGRLDFVEIKTLKTIP